MKAIIQEIILDFQETNLKTGVPRQLQTESVPGKATICIGVRRGGKSTYLFQIIRRLLDNGVSPQNILYLNFFDDRLHNLKHEPLSIINEAYFALYPEKKNSETIYCFFDEIQMVENWEAFVDRLLRTEDCQIYLTGSSAQMLSRDIATQMRGRALSWELFPFSFKEFLNSKGLDFKDRLSSKNKLIIEKAFNEYWETGSFPEVIATNRQLRIKIHQEYFQTILFRDVIERHDISHPKAITDLAYRLIDNIASLYSINSLTGYLKSLGHKCPKSAVSAYLEWLEDAYFFFTVPIYDASISRSKTNPKKIYCIDHSLITSICSKILVNSGHLLENLVFTALRRVTSSIYYYKTKKGLEVDFIALMPGKNRILVQVCETMADPGTRKREITAIKNAMLELGLKSSFIVTRDQEKEIVEDELNITVLPAWRFLLKMSA